VTRVETYAAALHEAAPEMTIARSPFARGAAQAMAEPRRFFDAIEPDIVEPSLAEVYPEHVAALHPELLERLRALHDLPGLLRPGRLRREDRDPGPGGRRGDARRRVPPRFALHG
jgi:hypothetical protein